jgi:hypothetical protein
MISFDDLGNLGRLGNQMFQYASLRGIASKHGYEYCIPPRSIFGLRDEKVKNTDITLYECFKLPEVEYRITNYPKVMEPPGEFHLRLWENCPDNINLFGYYQFKKYFEDIDNNIRQAFTFCDEILEPCREFIFKNYGNSPIISVHVRRTDYLHNIKFHPVQSIEYYQQALNNFSKEIPVLVFSDDVEWCKNQKIFSSDRFCFSEDNNSGVDLCLQSLCTYHIIANSSFSWWGSWLAKSEKIIAPKNWFGESCINKKVEDMQFGNWTWI